VSAAGAPPESNSQAADPAKLVSTRSSSSPSAKGSARGPTTQTGARSAALGSRAARTAIAPDYDAASCQNSRDRRGHEQQQHADWERKCRPVADFQAFSVYFGHTS